MSWFKKKKKEVDFSKELPDLKARIGGTRGIPDVPRPRGKTEEFPSYQNELRDIKRVIDKPISRPPVPSPTMEIPQRKPMLPQRTATLNPISPKPSSPIPQPTGRGKSIFVMIRRYII